MCGEFKVASCLIGDGVEEGTHPQPSWLFGRREHEVSGVEINRASGMLRMKVRKDGQAIDPKGVDGQWGARQKTADIGPVRAFVPQIQGGGANAAQTVARRSGAQYGSPEPAGFGVDGKDARSRGCGGRSKVSPGLVASLLGYPCGVTAFFRVWRVIRKNPLRENSVGGRSGQPEQGDQDLIEAGRHGIFLKKVLAASGTNPQVKRE